MKISLLLCLCGTFMFFNALPAEEPFADISKPDAEASNNPEPLVSLEREVPSVSELVANWAIDLMPRPAAVTLTSGERIEKCLVQRADGGAWVVHSFKRFWYPRQLLLNLEFSAQPLDAELQQWREHAEAERLKEAARMQEKDALKTEGSAVSPALENPVASDAAGTSSEENKGSAVASTSTTDRIDKTKSGGSDKVPARGLGGPHHSTGLGGSGEYEVRWIKEKREEVRLRDPYEKRGITVKLKHEQDMEYIDKGDVLSGRLTLHEPKLKTQDGREIEFVPLDQFGRIGSHKRIAR